jgi:hypothetical protein
MRLLSNQFHWLLAVLVVGVVVPAAWAVEGHDHDHGVGGAMAAMPAGGPAATTLPADAASVTVVLTRATEEHKELLVATVTRVGKPVENARVGFFARRTFGELKLGEEVTLDDGTAAVPFPQNLPGGTGGKLDFIARVKEPANLAGAIGRAPMDGGIVIPPEEDPFPRALWSPYAPLPLILVLVTLLSAVWATYGFVLFQLRKIRNGSPT